MLTHDELLRILRYDPETGIWQWRVAHGRWDRIKAGTEVRPTGKRRSVIIKKQQYLAARLAFFYMTGRWPQEVDHIDCDPTNDRWANLREANRSQQNTNRRSYSKTGFKGVKQVTGGWGYSAHIVMNKKSLYLGKRNTAEEAHQLYREAATKLHGNFARFE